MIDLSTGSFISLVLLRRGCRGGARFRVERVDRVKGVGEHPLPSASWAENTIMTECPQESGHLQSLVSGPIVEAKKKYYIDCKADICAVGKIPLQIQYNNLI